MDLPSSLTTMVFFPGVTTVMIFLSSSELDLELAPGDQRLDVVLRRQS